jgi:hypothetical protein
MCLINDEREPPNEKLFACSQEFILAWQITTAVPIQSKDFIDLWL